MCKITYVEHDGTPHPVDLANGFSVMEGAVRNGIPGIEGQCGGACSCATCHIYVDPAWLDKLPAADDNERTLLEYADDVRDNSRLACQIRACDELSGLVVRMPRTQG